MRMVAIGSLVLALVAATPASAQLTRAMRDYSGARVPIRGDIRMPAPVNPTLGRRASVSREVGAIREQIDAGRAAGQLDRREARALRREGRRIEATTAPAPPPNRWPRPIGNYSRRASR
jgi:hypothetical protein